MFDNSETKKAAIKVFAEKLLSDPSHVLELLVDEWHSIDEYHDVHIQEDEEHIGKFVCWVYPIVHDEVNGGVKTDCSDESVYYEVKLDLPVRIGCRVCKWTVKEADSPFCFSCRITEEGDD